ncbi:hypothetical protein STEG23_001933 [Scotinomys teguina]
MTVQPIAAQRECGSPAFCSFMATQSYLVFHYYSKPRTPDSSYKSTSVFEVLMCLEHVDHNDGGLLDGLAHVSNYGIWHSTYMNSRDPGCCHGCIRSSKELFQMKGRSHTISFVTALNFMR